MTAQGITNGKISEYLDKLRLERNKKWVKRKIAESECHKRMMEYYNKIRRYDTSKRIKIK